MPRIPPANDSPPPGGRNWGIVFTLGLLFVAGCASPPALVSRSKIRTELQQRTWHDIPCDSAPGEISLPPCVDLADGLTEEEAVALALWNNRDFLATLANLGIARGDLIQAGLLSNPQMNILFPPIGTKQLEWTLFVPIEALVLRKHRVAVAERDLQRIMDELVQNGLNVARDARVAFADFEFALRRAGLADQAASIRQGISELADKRHAAGDTGELEPITARIDAQRSRADAVGLREAVSVAEARLKNVLGIAMWTPSLSPVAADPDVGVELDADLLVAEAMAARPDVKAARIAVQAAQYRETLARKSFLRIDTVADGNSGGAGPTNTGPGLRFEIPIFNRNQGLVIRSQWSVDQASHNFFAVRDRVATEVRASIGGVRQAEASLHVLQAEVLPALQDSVQLAERAYQQGGDTYLLVLQATSQYVDSRIRELELVAALRRSIAELDRSVGQRVAAPPASLEEPLSEPLPLPEIDEE